MMKYIPTLFIPQTKHIIGIFNNFVAELLEINLPAIPDQVEHLVVVHFDFVVAPCVHSRLDFGHGGVVAVRVDEVDA